MDTHIVLKAVGFPVAVGSTCNSVVGGVEVDRYRVDRWAKIGHVNPFSGGEGYTLVVSEVVHATAHIDHNLAARLPDSGVRDQIYARRVDIGLFHFRFRVRNVL